MKIIEVPGYTTYEISFSEEEAELVLHGDYQNENGLREWLTWDSEISENVVDSESNPLQNSFSITLEEDDYLLLSNLIDKFIKNATLEDD